MSILHLKYVQLTKVLAGPPGWRGEGVRMSVAPAGPESLASEDPKSLWFPVQYRKATVFTGF